MRQFYLAFPIGHALRDELGWTHYRILMREDDPIAREWYMNECVAGGWSSRDLDRQVSTTKSSAAKSRRRRNSTACRCRMRNCQNPSGRFAPRRKAVANDGCRLSWYGSDGFRSLRHRQGADLQHRPSLRYAGRSGKPYSDLQRKGC